MNNPGWSVGMRHFDTDVAASALARWEGDPSTLQHVATSGNSVYRFMDRGRSRILRLSDPEYRPPAQNHGEASFLQYLADRRLQVAAPVLSKAGESVELLDICSASVFTWAAGVTVASENWNETFVRIICVYASRVMAFGAHPTEEQQRTLATLRTLALRPLEWA